MPGQVPAPPGEAGTGLSLPAVWSTRPLDKPVRDLALAGGAASAIAVAYQGGGVQFFNLEGDRTTEIADISARAVSQGAYLEFGETALTLFPGIGSNDRLTAFIHSAGLAAPAELALPVETNGSLMALCSRALGSGENGGLELAFWSAGDAVTTRGVLGTDGDAFTFLQQQGVSVPAGANGCSLSRDGIRFSIGEADIASLETAQGVDHILLGSGGGFSYSAGGEEAVPLAVRNGISVKMPGSVDAMDGLGQPLGGGYPGGVIVVAGDTGTAHQLVFIDTSGLNQSAGN